MSGIRSARQFHAARYLVATEQKIGFSPYLSMQRWREDPSLSHSEDTELLLGRGHNLYEI